MFHNNYCRDTGNCTGNPISHTSAGMGKNISEDCRKRAESMKALVSFKIVMVTE